MRPRTNAVRPLSDSHTDITRSPLFEAEHASRYERQRLIAEYEETVGCRFVVMFDFFDRATPTNVEELLFDVEKNDELHLLLWSPGGDGEVAVRVLRSITERCSRFVVVVPDIAKSAGTLFVLGADEIVMGPTSDLGPVDPQLRIESTGEKWSAAKDIIRAVEEATQAVQKNPDTYPIHASLLADVDALLVRRAHAELNRTSELVKQALSCNRNYTSDEVEQLAKDLTRSLIDIPDTHAAIFGAKEAVSEGLKAVVSEDPSSERWRLVWKLWTRYFTLNKRIYEARKVSHVVEWEPLS